MVKDVDAGGSTLTGGIITSFLQPAIISRQNRDTIRRVFTGLKIAIYLYLLIWVTG